MRKGFPLVLIGLTMLWFRCNGNNSSSPSYDTTANNGSNKASKPFISPSTDTYTKQIEVSITSTTSGASVYYTTNGETPTNSSPKYENPLTIGKSIQVKAIAMKSGLLDSDIATADYTISNPSWYFNWNIDSTFGYDDMARAIVTDSQNNIYIAGNSEDSFNDRSYWRVKKIFVNGIVDTSWDKSYYMPNIDARPSDIAVDSLDNVYVAGCFYDPNANSGAGSTVWKVKKYDKSGSEDSVWNANVLLPASGCINSITIDKNDNVFLVGSIFGAGLVKKISPDGIEDFSWNISLAGYYIYDSAVDSQNNLYIAGKYSGNWFVKKYKTDGSEDLTWNITVDSLADLGTDRAEAIAVDVHDNVYIGGKGTNLVSVNSNDDWWIKKYYPNGAEDVSWNLKFSSTSNIDEEVVQSLKFDSFGNLYASGISSNTGSNNNNYLKIKKIRPDGSEDTAWEKNLIYYYNYKPFNMTIDNNDNIYSLISYFGLSYYVSGDDWWIQVFR